jgi:hypothetical protein
MVCVVVVIVPFNYWCIDCVVRVWCMVCELMIVVIVACGVWLLALLLVCGVWLTTLSFFTNLVDAFVSVSRTDSGAALPP